MLKKYRTRLAPSPSGHLHVGHAQTFWIAQERALSRQGEIILRIEDIDFHRCKPRFVEEMIEDLQWFGINWNNSPLFAMGGMHEESTKDNSSIAATLIKQSDRINLYQQAWLTLFNLGHIYPCKYSRKDVENALSAPHDNYPRITTNRPISDSVTSDAVFPPILRPAYMVNHVIGSNSHYPNEIRAMSSPNELKCNWRFRVPDGEIVRFVDGLCGYQEYQAGVDFGDFLVWRSDGAPSYELAVVVDDLLMGITEVVRGEDLLLSTARQILLIQAIFHKSENCISTEMSHKNREKCDDLINQVSIKPDYGSKEDIIESNLQHLSPFESVFDNHYLPQYFHVPLLCDEFGVRLAKRNFAKSLRQLREEGFTPSSIREKYFNIQNEQLWK
eukprot:gene11041-14825_t